MKVKRLISMLLCVAFLAVSASGCAQKKAESDKQNIEYKVTIDNHYSSTDESTVNTYKRLCEAVMAYEPEISINAGAIDDVNSLFYTSFPLYTLVDSINIKEDKSGFTITYKYSQEEHSDKVSAFSKAISDIMTECGYGKVSKNLYILNVYNYICQNITIDYSITSVVDTAIEKKGINATVSGLFECLLLQSDIPASHILVVENESISNIVSMAKLCDNYYFFDIASEISDTDGNGLRYFAMTTKRAQQSNEEFSFTDNVVLDDLSDATYDKLADCTSYRVDGNKVTANCGDFGEFEFELN